MATDHHNHDHMQAHHSDVDYERSDLGHRGIWAFFAFLAISGLVIAIAIGALYKGFGFAQAKFAPEANPMAVNQKAPPPAEMENSAPVDIQKFSANGTQPLLQTNDVADMATFLAEEETLLKASPWKEQNGTVHLPIEHAMQLVMQRNQPVRANGNDPSVKDPNMVPSESGFFAVAAVHQQADATMVEGAPVGDTMNRSEDSGATQERTIKGVSDSEPKNPARGQGEHQSASPEQKLKTPAPTAKAPKQ